MSNKHKLISAFLALITLGTNAFAASSDLACQEVPISIYYSKAYTADGGNQYVYYNGVSTINVTPPTSTTSKKLSALSSKFSSVSLDTDKKWIVFGSATVDSSDSKYAYVEVLKSGQVEIGIYYAGYTDSNGTQQYVYFNGASVINVTPPTGETAKKLTAMTTQFVSPAVTVSQDGKLVFNALVGESCDTVDTPPSVPDLNTTTLSTPPTIPSFE